MAADRPRKKKKTDKRRAKKKPEDREPRAFDPHGPREYRAHDAHDFDPHREREYREDSERGPTGEGRSAG
jgi:hypothetical protein